jgi:hypothetical protein
MKYRILSVSLTAAILLLSSGLTLAIENKTVTPQQAVNPADANPKSSKSDVGVKHKPVKIKLVDINSAKKAELVKLPGISDAEADKIIAARPLGSKAWLVSHGLIPMLTYQAIKGKVVCKLTQKDIDIIMANADKNKAKK